MAKRKKLTHPDESLGVNAPITRRDYLNSTLVASGGVLLGAVGPLQLLGREDWNGYGGIGDYGASNGNTWEVMTDGHKIRDHVYDRLPAGAETNETYDCVVVGGGISGLSAALFFSRQTGGRKSCLVLENHAIFGGEARRNEFDVNGRRLIAHQGSAMYFPPLSGSFLEEFYHSVGIRDEEFAYQEWSGKDQPLEVGLTPYFAGGKTSAYYFGKKFGQERGFWLVDPWGKQLEGAPISPKAREEWLRTHRPSVVSQMPKEHGDAISRHLDSITLEQHLMEAHSISRETVRTFLSPSAGGGSGLGADALSAYAEYAADVLLPWNYSKKAQMFPGGNAGVARHIVKAILPGVFDGGATMAEVANSPIHFDRLDRTSEHTRIRLRATAIAVEHDGPADRASAVRVVYLKDGKLYRVTARSVIVAGGSWTAKHILRDLPPAHREAYAQFHRAPCLMANVALRNWRFLYEMGISGFQWFEGFGSYTAVRRTATLGGIAREFNPDSPVVLTLKILFSQPGLPLQEQVTRGRAELYSTPFAAYERKIREQFAMMFGSKGFDPKRDITAIVLNRWGHAYLSPQPGFFFGTEKTPAPGDFLRNHPHGRIAFANSDVAGIMDHRTSILEARRAAGQAVAVLG